MPSSGATSSPSSFKTSSAVPVSKSYLQFLFLRVVVVQKPIPVDPSIDRVWHQHIINTRHYAAFCEFLKGGEKGFYLHHTPAAAGNAKEAGDAHAKHFGEETAKVEYNYEGQMLCDCG